MTKAIASPSVRSLAARRGIDIDALAGRLGRETVVREDVVNTMQKSQHGAAAFWDVDHAAYGPVSEEPIARISRVAAKNLSAAQTLIPAVTHHDEAEIGAIEDLRAKFKLEAANRGTRLTALAFHVAVLTRCLQEFPRFNASLSADGEVLVLKNYCHVGLAVDTPRGLVVPVIRNTDQKGIFAIADDIADLANRSRENAVRPEEMGGASMTITNLGGIGGTAFTPIVNPPEVAILGITRTTFQPVWDGEQFKPVKMVPLDLSYDHRVIDGAMAARFLAHYARLIAEPRRLLL